MAFVSILNDVIGPVMRGPSSSHTAGAYRIGKMARFLLGTTPSSARFTFDSHGSYAQTYKPQGADLAFVTGLMDETLTNRRFFDALDRAESRGVRIEFHVTPLKHVDHPNTVRINTHGLSIGCTTGKNVCKKINIVIDGIAL